MTLAIKQTVTVKPGGLIEVRSPELREGDRAEVTVVIPTPSSEQPVPNDGNWERFLGSLRGPDPDGGNNEKIDADLAAEYGCSHETDL